MTELGIELNDTSIELGIESNVEAISYNGLVNKPQINSVELIGNKTSSDLGLQSIINDLATIRSGASLGATSIQPNDNVSELVNDAGYLTQHQSPSTTSKDKHI